MSRRPAMLLVRLAARLLPAPLRGWGRAMEAEAGAIDGGFAVLGFALGCVGCAMRERVRFHLPVRSGAGDFAGEETIMAFWNRRPRLFAGLCATGATALGLAWMTSAGAPGRYLAVNAMALLLGVLAVALLGRVGDLRRGIVDLMLVALLLLTALIGASADGVTRWVSIGGIMLQPSLILLPIVILRFARSRDMLSTLAVLIAALALALQPDRAMAGTLAAAMAVLAWLRPGRNVLAALAGAAAAFAATLLRADPSPAMPFVDQIFYSSFAVHPLAGLAVAAGAILLVVPAAVGLAGAPQHRLAHAMFGTLWLGVISAAMLGNYPTPVVGYGGSAVLGYLVSLLGLPMRAETAMAKRDHAAAQPEEDAENSIRAGLPIGAPA